MLLGKGCSSTVATEIATKRQTKKQIKKRKVWNRHHIYYRKLWKTIKKRARSTKTDLRYGSWLCVRKVLAPYSIRPKTIPLIKIQMDVVSFKCLFSKIKNNDK